MTDTDWETRRILILGKTYPSYSKKYGETACTGGILWDTYEMVRLYPIPFRYLEGEQAFKSWQVIEAQVKRDSSDPRPESYRVNFRTIRLMETIPSNKPNERRGYLERSRHFCKSVEDLRERQKTDGISLGIVQPREVLGCDVEPKDESERDLWDKKEQEVTAQLKLFGEPSKPLDYIEARFVVEWRCRDDRCKTAHHMYLHQWGIHELFRKYRNDPAGKDQILKAMWQQLDLSKRDVFLFLGSFRTTPFNFGLMDSYSPPRRDQMSLIRDFPLREDEE